MTIGIIGSGNIGGTLTRKLTALGHIVYLANSRGPASLTEIAQQTGAIPVSAKEAVANAELVIVTIPQKSILDLPGDLFYGVGENIPVIDTGNYYPNMRDGELDDLSSGLPDSEWVQQHLGRSVVKVFNNIAYTSLADGGKPRAEAERIGLPVASDDERAKIISMKLVDELGFDPVDGGTIRESWRQQPGTAIYCTDMTADAITAQLTQMGSVRTPEQLETQVANRTAQEEYIIKMYMS